MFYYNNIRHIYRISDPLILLTDENRGVQARCITPAGNTPVNIEAIFHAYQPMLRAGDITLSIYQPQAVQFVNNYLFCVSQPQEKLFFFVVLNCWRT